MNDMTIKNKWKKFAVDQLTCASNCTDGYDPVAVYDKLAGGEVIVVSEVGLEIWEPFVYWEFKDFCDYMVLLATTAQSTELKSDGHSVEIKNKWKKYVIEQYVASYDKSISKMELYNQIALDGSEAVAKYGVEFFTIYSNLSMEKVVRLIVANAMMIQQLDNEYE